MTEKKLIDDCFYVEQSRWKTWSSYTKDGKKLITSLHEDGCIHATRFYLKFKQENQFESENNGENMSKYSGTMDYKL
jgi:hypothetical protein